MFLLPKVGKKKTTTKKEPKKRFCLGCKKEKPEDKFYKSTSSLFPDGICTLCKDCFTKDISSHDRESVKNGLMQLNLPYVVDVWETTYAKHQETAFGQYVRQLNSLPQYKGLTWNNSDVRPDIITYSKNAEIRVTEDMLDKWGYGYKPEEYMAFEKKYQTLKNNYPEKTAMHTEALLKYIRYSVKEEMATALNDIGSAKSWGQMAKDAATAAKINPSQLSAADLQDGLSTFGQLVRAVEQSEDIIPILPKFKEMPQDKVDFTIWCYINYVRDMRGLALCEYSEIYKFYEDRKKEYETRADFLNDDSSDEGDDS